MRTATVVCMGSYPASGLDLGCFGASERQHLKAYMNMWACGLLDISRQFA